MRYALPISRLPGSRLRLFPHVRELQLEMVGKLALTRKGKVQIQKKDGIKMIKIIENLKII